MNTHRIPNSQAEKFFIAFEFGGEHVIYEHLLYDV